MMLVRACLVALALAPQEAAVRDLLSRLDDDAIETRTEAARELVRLGKPALPEIQKALATAAGERRERLAEIARRIGELERLSALLRPASRITLEASDRPLREVLEALGKQAGTALDLEDVPGDEKVSVTVRALPFWDALDAVCRASGKVLYEAERDGVALRAEPYAALPRRVVNGIAVFLSSIEISSSGVFGDPDRSDSMGLQVAVAWEKGTRPTFVQVRLAALSDETGKDLLPAEEDGEGASRIPVGAGELLATAVLATDRLPDPKAKKLARLRLEVDCGFVLRYGGVAFRDPGTRGPEALECPQYAVTLVSSRRQDGEFTATLKVEYRAGAEAAVTAESFDLKLDDGTSSQPRVQETSSDGTSTTYTIAWPLDEKRVPRELAVRTPIETHVERIPVDLKDVPLE